ncbi:glycoside hydrolase family 17 protein [Xylariomycetidae sp. FL0641]|nr:glycoside hydrolase family 17 protein [Xylariomycetidae sp. FL0641]
MRFSSAAAGLLATTSTALAANNAANSGIKGFNTGAFFLNQAPKLQVDFAYEFNRMHNLPGTSGWNSARLYSMIQWGTASDIIQAIPAAIETKTTLLLGLWVSGGDAAIANEIAALEKAYKKYGKKFTDLVVGISVGSEDLYRDAAPKEIGTSPQYLIDCITKVRNKIAKDMPNLKGKPIGHVDTYDSFLNGTNTKVVDHLDWIGFDGYPYWESGAANAIGNAAARFYDGYHKTVALAKGKPVYVTETGWPVKGPKNGQAVANAANARRYWQDIACSLIESNINVWWYTLQESQWGQASPDFGVYPAGDLGQLKPSYQLSC